MKRFWVISKLIVLVEYESKDNDLELFHKIQDNEDKDESQSKSSDPEFRNSTAKEYQNTKMELFDWLPHFDRDNFKISKITEIIPRMLFDKSKFKISVSLICKYTSNQSIITNIYQQQQSTLLMQMHMHTVLVFFIMRD